MALQRAKNGLDRDLVTRSSSVMTQPRKPALSAAERRAKYKHAHRLSAVFLTEAFRTRLKAMRLRSALSNEAILDRALTLFAEAWDRGGGDSAVAPQHGSAAPRAVAGAGRSGKAPIPGTATEELPPAQRAGAGQRKASLRDKMSEGNTRDGQPAVPEPRPKSARSKRPQRHELVIMDDLFAGPGPDPD